MTSGSIVSGKITEMSKEEFKEHIRKINALQRRLTSAVHIKKINNLIPAAEEYAKNNAGGDTTLRSRLFVQEMNRLTCDAGLRYCS